ncbi:S-adenosyl-L-methionine-dependent methyltransferase [Mycena galopus ATCC 62051]|nr:S-adenosyl-L-methionine-dependent methyltransferase [Mycena galopus ATCC 62051]
MNLSAPYQTQVYDSLADNYDAIWETPYMHILLPHFRRTIRALDLPSKSVLDLACGTGVLLAEAGRLGASHLVGIDISAGMVGSGLRQHSGDFQFHVADCSRPLDHLNLELGTFDLITAGWLLHYAQTRDDMAGMWGNIARHLKPGGVFVGIIHTYQLPPHQPAVTDFTFGCRWKDIRPLLDGQGPGVRMTIEFNTKPRVEFENRQFERQVVEELAAEAGLVCVEYLIPDVEVVREMGQEAEAEFWQPLLDYPPNQIIRATKSLVRFH